MDSCIHTKFSTKFSTILAHTKSSNYFQKATKNKRLWGASRAAGGAIAAKRKPLVRIEDLINLKVGCPYYYFSRHYQIAVKIRPLYLTHYVYYLTSNTTGVASNITKFPYWLVLNIFT
jgi:hypothetical protein